MGATLEIEQIVANNECRWERKRRGGDRVLDLSAWKEGEHPRAEMGRLRRAGLENDKVLQLVSMVLRGLWTPLEGGVDVDTGA